MQPLYPSIVYTTLYPIPTFQTDRWTLPLHPLSDKARACSPGSRNPNPLILLRYRNRHTNRPHPLIDICVSFVIVERCIVAASQFTYPQDIHSSFSPNPPLLANTHILLDSIIRFVSNVYSWFCILDMCIGPFFVRFRYAFNDSTGRGKEEPTEVSPLRIYSVKIKQSIQR